MFPLTRARRGSIQPAPASNVGAGSIRRASAGLQMIGCRRLLPLSIEYFAAGRQRIIVDPTSGRPPALKLACRELLATTMVSHEQKVSGVQLVRRDILKRDCITEPSMPPEGHLCALEPCFQLAA